MANEFRVKHGLISEGNISGTTFYGDGSGLTNIPSSGITGLNLSQISSNGVTASVSSSGLTVNSGAKFNGNVSGSTFYGNGIGLTGITHNSDSGLQGGSSNEYYHLSSGQLNRVLSLIYVNGVTTLSTSTTTIERGVSTPVSVIYNIISNDDVFTGATINNISGGTYSVLSNVNQGSKTLSAGSFTNNVTFTLTNGYTRNSIPTGDTKTATYSTYVPQWAGISSLTDITQYSDLTTEVSAGNMSKYIQSLNTITKISSPTSKYIWFVSNAPSGTIQDGNNFVQSVGTWNDGVSEFYKKSFTLTLLDSTTVTVYLYRSREVKTLTSFTYKIS